MIHTVYILGAGASQDAGAPLMPGFIDRAEDLLESFPQETQESVRRVLKARHELHRCRSYCTLEVKNIEELFSVVETADLLGHLGDISPEEIHGLPTDMRRLIVWTLTKSMQFIVEKDQLRVRGSYPNFVTKVLCDDRGHHKGDIGIITFNYDVGLDFALTQERFDFDYCLGGMPPDRKISLMKLHGSVNWLRCASEGCGGVAPFNVADLLRVTGFPPWDEPHRVDLVFDATHQVKRPKHCEQPAVGPPVIVPPTWAKLEHQRQIANVWKAAARSLTEAKKVVVIGYSLPRSDQFFRHMLAISLSKNERLHDFVVVNPDQNNRDSFKRMLGPSVLDCFDFRPAAFSTSFAPDAQPYLLPAC